MSEWQECLLGQLIEQGKADLQTGPFGTMLHSSEYTSTGTPVIAVQDIGENELKHSKFVYVSQDTVNRLSRYMVQEDDIIFGRKGAVERRAIIKESEAGWVQGSDCIRLRLNGSIDSKFISYQFGSKSYREWMLQHATGATMPSLNQRVLKLLPIMLPSLPEQRAIAQVLSSLDDKIDLLHRQNKTLEAIAETLFRHWFIEGAQDDWEEVPITDLFEIRDGTHDSPKKKTVGKSLITSKHILDGRLDIGNAYLISDEDFNKVNQRSKVDTGDILFSMIGTIGLIYFEQSQNIDYAIKNIGLFKTSQNPDWAIYTYLWLKSSIGQQFIDEHKSGSTQEYVSLGNLRSITFQIPQTNTLKDFNVLASEYFRKISLNFVQIFTLEKLRDTLLPKLMSGEVRIKLD
ncbi:restriction endonuclease subunit S [cf. Phormidesmis sp. LEGE 11477]|uniref:restriction endonuclease subunit S n=1 Tax=cf. Phormidesmis sp. LEGE 11477 TaxID=1828680 RepID=UPI00187EECEC|nr:restriction endonuclease subunit S [cf. Phormidesmis sp. LEGE 11477]MBE9063784.1 restriction endonuclease subunit S [cf. Phormidesmis sp. LEGE 11477]